MQFAVDVGEREGLCSGEAGGEAGGVFARKHSKGTVSVNCNTFVATLGFAPKAEVQIYVSAHGWWVFVLFWDRTRSCLSVDLSQVFWTD